MLQNGRSFIDSIIHDEVYCIHDEEASIRRMEDLRDRTASAQRIGELALHALAIQLTPYIKHRLEKPYNEAGYEVLGAGFRSTVYKCNDEPVVHKLHRASAHMNTQDKNDLIEEYRVRQRTAEYYLGTFALTQSFSVESHPIKPDLRAVTGRQPFVQFRSLYSSGTTHQPHIRGQIRLFASRAEQMTLDTGFIVDVKGTNNLVVTNEDELLLIDTIPCDPAIAPDRALNLAMRRLQELTDIARN